MPLRPQRNQCQSRLHPFEVWGCSWFGATTGGQERPLENISLSQEFCEQCWSEGNSAFINISLPFIEIGRLTLVHTVFKTELCEVVWGISPLEILLRGEK